MDSQPSPERQAPRSRLEDEVIEILNKADRPPSNVVKFQSRVRQQRYAAPNRMRSIAGRVQITGLSIMIAMIGFAILAAVIEDSSPLLGKILAIASICCLIALFVRRWVKPEQPQIKTWRGRDIDFRGTSQRPAWLDRWLGGPKGPRR